MDYQGTLNLLAAAKQADVEHVVLISSIGADDNLYPLNLLFGILFWKKRAEEALQRSGLRYTIVRPGGTIFAHQFAVHLSHSLAWHGRMLCAVWPASAQTFRQTCCVAAQHQCLLCRWSHQRNPGRATARKHCDGRAKPLWVASSSPGRLHSSQPGMLPHGRDVSDL